MEITFWGVRGSIPVPGRSTLRYGGNTPCLEVRADGKLLILDAGSGIRELGIALQAEQRPLDVHLFITHTHWDHIQGFPFFAPAYMTGSRITVYGPKVLPNGIEGALDSQMHGAFFPLDFKSLPAIVEFRDIDNSVVNLESVTIRSTFLTHPNLSLGYRIESDSGTMVYATDWEPFTRFCVTAPDVNAVWRSTNLARAIVADEAMVEFCKGAGLLVCDAQYDSEEYSSRRGWGHSCVDDIVQLGLNAGVRRLALFHHDPMHDDLTIDRMVAKCRLQVRSARRRMAVFGARERVTVSLSH